MAASADNNMLIRTMEQELLRTRKELEEANLKLQAEVAERKAASKALVETEYLLKLLLDSNPSLMSVRDENSLIVLSNKAFADFFRLTPEEVRGRSYPDLCAGFGIEENDLLKIIEDDRRVINSGEPLFKLKRYGYRNGQVRWFRTSKLPVTLWDGRRCALVISGEITERKLMEDERERLLEEIDASRSLLQAVIDNASAGICVIGGKDLQIKWANEQCAALLEIPREGVTGLSINALLPDRGEGRIAGKIAKVASTGQSHFEPEFRLEGQGRDITYWCLSLIPLSRPGGGTSDVMLMAVEITEQISARKKAEQQTDEIRRQAQEREALIRITSDILAETTIEGVMGKVVDSAREITGSKEGISGWDRRDGTVQVSTGCVSGLPRYRIGKEGMFLQLIERSSLRIRKDKPVPMPVTVPESHPSLKGLLSAKLVGQKGQGIGFIAVSDKENGDFTDGDAALLSQLAALASLGLQHIEARNSAEVRAAELNTILESMSEGLVIAGMTGNVITMNAAALRINGFRDIEEARKNISQYAEFFEMTDLAGKPLPITDWPLSRALRGETVVNFEVGIRRLDTGKEWIASYSAAPVLNKSGEPMLAITTLRDITALKAAEEELRNHRDSLEYLVNERTAELRKANESLRKEFIQRKETYEAFQLFRNLIDQSNDSIFVLEPETGKILDINTEACKNLGYTNEELLQMYIFDISMNYYSDDIWKRFVVQVRERGFLITEGELIRKEGSVFHVESNVKFIAQEKKNYMVAVVRDITDRVRNEEERARLAAAAEATAEAIVITDPDGEIQYVNPAFEHITGFSAKEAIGSNLNILRSDRHDKAFYQNLWSVLKQGSVWRGQFINKKKDGTLYQEEGTISPVKNASGEIINFVAIKRDITEKSRLESIAEAVNTMNNIGYIFSGIRHEIGNPINSIKMTLSVLKSRMKDYSRETIIEYIERTLTEVSRVEYLLRNLKNFNMYETPELQNLNMNQFMERFMSLVIGDFRKKGIGIEHSIQSEAGWGFADPRALQQVMLNVLTNASDALEGKDDPLIRISLFRMGEVILIRIADNGGGIPEEQQRNLFKPFSTSKPHGTGLGLVIAKKMLTRMNGAIEIASQKDSGTIVDIFIQGGKRAE